MTEYEESDVFADGSEPVIVDCDVLEAAKENIQPLAKGRRVTALQAILATPHALRESRLASTRNKLRINVEVALEDEDDDPLEAYCHYVYWVVENYPQGHSAESGLLELLEEATRVLKDNQDGKWREDIRYLKLWVLYASYVEKPTIIFKFCLVNEIGTNHALLYEEYAIALERASRKTAADEIYSLGIARRAEPLGRLESKYQEFQKRMISHIALHTATEPLLAIQPSTTRGITKPRKALADTSRSRHTPSSSSALPTSDDADVFTVPTTGVQRPNGRMQVFADPPEGNVTESQTAPWPELGTRKSRIKENLVEASKAAGTTLHQAGKKTRELAAKAPRMMVYRDPEEHNQNQHQEGSTQTSHSKVYSGNSIEVEEELPPPKADNFTALSAEQRVEVTSLPEAVGYDQDNQVELAPEPAAPERRITRSAARNNGGLVAVSLTVEKRSRTTRSSAKAIAQELEEGSRVAKKGKDKAKLLVYKDKEESEQPEDPVQSQEPATVTEPTRGRERTTLFCGDFPDIPAPTKTTLKDKGKTAVYRDEFEPPAATESSERSKLDKSSVLPKTSVYYNGPERTTLIEPPPRTSSSSKFAVFCDTEPPEPALIPTLVDNGKGCAPGPRLIVHRDDNGDGNEDGQKKPSSENEMLPPLPRSKPAKTTRTASGSKLAFFRDPIPAKPELSLSRTASVKGESRTGAKPKLAVYCDAPDDSGQALATPVPKAIPYKDEDLPPTPTVRGMAPPSVMKEKPLVAAGGRGAQMNTEAEALRKDPLKNYAFKDRISDVE